MRRPATLLLAAVLAAGCSAGSDDPNGASTSPTVSTTAVASGITTTSAVPDGTTTSAEPGDGSSTSVPPTSTSSTTATTRPTTTSSSAEPTTASSTTAPATTVSTTTTTTPTTTTTTTPTTTTTTTPTTTTTTAPSGVRNGTRNQACEQDQFNRINEARAADGQAGLTYDGGIQHVPLDWSDEMAGRQVLSHNPDYGAQIGAVRPFRVAGENVGRGYSSSAVFTAFMNSDGHRRNILFPDYTHAAVGCVQDTNGQLWITQNFWG